MGDTKELQETMEGFSENPDKDLLIQNLDTVNKIMESRARGESVNYFV